MQKISIANRSVFSRFITEFVTAILIFVFCYTAITKLSEIEKFQSTLVQSPVIGNLSVLISWLVPVCLLAISILLFIPRTKGTGLALSLIAMTLFSGYVGYMILFASALPCSCGSVFRSMTWNQQLWFNLGLTALTLIAFVHYRHDKLFIAINRNSRTPV